MLLGVVCLASQKQRNRHLTMAYITTLMPETLLPRVEPNYFDPSAADEKLLEKMPEWMRPDQVAKVLGDCSRETVRQFRLRGSLQCRDFRAPDAKQPCWRFYKASVRAFLSKLPTGQSEWT